MDRSAVSLTSEFGAFGQVLIVACDSAAVISHVQQVRPITLRPTIPIS